MVQNTIVLTNLGSDHLPVTFEIGITPLVEEKFEKFNYKKANWVGFSNKINQEINLLTLTNKINTISETNISEFDNIIQQFINTIIAARNSSITRISNLSGPQEILIPENILFLKKLRNSQRRKFNLTKALRYKKM